MQQFHKKTMKPNSEERREHFYESVRLVAICMKAMGIFTMKNATTTNGKLLQHKTFNLTTLWFGFLMIVNFNVMVQANMPLIFIAQTSSHILRTMITGMIIFGSEKTFLKAIKDIEAFDEEFLGDTALGSKRRGLLGFYKLLAFFSLHIALSYILGGLSFFIMWHCVINVTTQTILAVMLLIIQEELICRYSYLNGLWNTRVNKAKAYSKEILIEKLRTSHGKLGIIVQNLNNSCGLRVIMLFFTTIFEILLFFHNPENRNDVLNRPIIKAAQAVFYLSELLLGFMVLTSASRLSTKTRDILRCFRSTLINGLSPYCKQQMIFLSTQIYVKQMKVTAGGLFELNRSVAISMCLTGATYLLLCYQSRYEIANMLDAYGRLLRHLSIEKANFISMIIARLGI